MKKLIFNYLKPQNYYFRLFIFFTIITLILAFSMGNFKLVDFDLFVLRFFLIYFLLLFIAVAIEFLHSGEYISPLKIYDLEFFFNSFLKDLKENKKHLDIIFENYFNKYDSKSKQILKKLFSSRYKIYFLSSIRKEKGVYILTFINKLTLFRYFFIRFFIKQGIHKAYIKEINHNFKIIRIE